MTGAVALYRLAPQQHTHSLRHFYFGWHLLQFAVPLLASVSFTIADHCAALPHSFR